MKVHRNILNNIYYRCDHCDYKNANRKNFKNHMLIHTSLESRPKYHCSHCPEIFYRLLTRKLHERKVHTNASREHHCHCGRVYKSKAGLASHQKNLHGHEEFPCEHCSEVFSSKERRRIHFNKKHKTKVSTDKRIKLTKAPGSLNDSAFRKTCQECGKVFVSEFGYRNHLINHNGPQPQAKLEPCPYCGKQMQHSSLHAHVIYKLFLFL